ncbi:MAG: hypothetical protein HY902_15600 [Deltaproteobacteria bacterium]|nr:hypothetical protein [Deltaproteobacteria bacterium]
MKLKTSIVLSILTLALAVTAGCAQKASERIVGKWSIDTAKTEALEDIKSLSEDKRGAALALVQKLATTTTFEIAPGKLTTDTAGQKTERAFTITGETGYQVVCESKVDGKVEHGTLTFQGETLVLNQSNPKMTVALVRK